MLNNIVYKSTSSNAVNCSTEMQVLRKGNIENTQVA